MRSELYFLSSQKNRPSLFGMPLIVPCTVHTSKKDLYDAVWIQVSRLAIAGKKMYVHKKVN